MGGTAVASGGAREIAGGGARTVPSDGRAPVRVMHVLHTLQPGGMEFGVVKVVNGLDRSRVQSSICSTATIVAGMRSFVAPDVPVFEMRRRAGNDPWLVWELYRLFRRERPQIVHTHAWGTLVEGIVAARLAGVAVVVHGEHGTLQLRPYQARIQRWAWGRATRVLSVSRRLTERMAAGTGFATERIRTIQNGVDCGRFSPSLRDAARRELGLADGTFVIGTAGRLVPVKNQAALVDAVALLRDRGVPVTALVAGAGPLRSSLEARIRAHDLDAHVTLLGQRPDIERLFAALDVFVLPSLSEGLSNTILEAMASGAPAVVTRVGGADELVDDGCTGLIVPPDDPGALAEAISDLAAHPERRRAMGAAARLRAEGEFSLSRMLRDYERLYVELGDPRRSLVLT